MNNNLSFESLLDKYLAGSISEDERKILYNFLSSPAYRIKLDEMVDKELKEGFYRGEDNRVLLASIQENISKSIQHKKSSGKIFWVNIRRLSAAAILILLLGIGAMRWFNKSKKGVSEIAALKPAKSEIKAGTNKAVLQLADSSVIVLDALAKGLLTKQGNVKIIKTDSGVIAYHSAPSSNEVIYNTLTTPKGGQYQLVLNDGTKVWLNAASSLHFPVAFSGKERIVELTGEGYFEVAKIASVPFKVKMNNTTVEVLGTHFNINAYNDEEAIRTSLLEGSVKVVTAQSTRLLKPGQQAAINKSGILVQNADVNAAIAWKNGMFEFEKTNLQAILRQAARWYDVDFVYKRNINANFTGQISRSINLEQLLHILELTDKVHFRIAGKKILVDR